MLKSTPNESPRSDETTIISNGVKIEGKLSTSGNIRIDGEIQGDVISQRDVIVGENGNVNGQINADSITIGGRVNGITKAKNKLVINSKGNLKGDIFTNTLVIEAGAKFDGKSNMGESRNFSDNKTLPKQTDSSGK